MDPSVTIHDPPMLAELDDLDGEMLKAQARFRIGVCSKHMETDCRKLCEEIYLWTLPSKRYGVAHWKRVASDWNEFCQTHIGHEEGFIHAMVSGYHAAEKNQALPVKQAIEIAASLNDKLSVHGCTDRLREKGPGRGQKTQAYGVSLGFSDETEADLFTRKPSPEPEKPKRKSYGNGKGYLLRRLARDAPEVLEAYGRGEYASVAAAARDAGFGPRANRKRITLPTEVGRLVELLREHYSNEDIEELKSLLGAD